MPVNELLAVPAPRVLLPRGRIDLRLDAEVWAQPLVERSVRGLAVLFRPGRTADLAKVGTLGGIVGRRTEGDTIFVRLRGLRRLRVLGEPRPAEVVTVSVDDAAGDDTAVAPEVRELRRLIRRYHGHLAELGDRADITVELPADSEAAVYAVASLLRVSTHEHQFVLEADSLDERLARVTAMLEREIRLLQGSMGAKGA